MLKETFESSRNVLSLTRPREVAVTGLGKRLK